MSYAADDSVTYYWRRFCCGSTELDAIKEELEKLHDSAFGWAMTCCGRDRDLAAEVLQQAYCRMLDGKASFSGKSEFRTWVFGVIRLVALEEVRRQSRQQQHTPSNGNADITKIAASELENTKLEDLELAGQLDAALARLSKRQREVLHLVFYQGLTIEQTAGVLAINVGSARQHYQRGKTSLRRMLEANSERHGE